MAESLPRQKRITGRVLHEFKHGELKSGRSGKGGKVKSRRQAIAIALQEAGASNTTAPSVTAVTFVGPSRKKQGDGPRSRSAKANLMSAHTESGRAPRRWQAATPAADRARPSRGGCPRPQSRRLYPSRTLREGKTEKRGRPLENVQAAAGERAGDRLSGLKARIHA